MQKLIDAVVVFLRETIWLERRGARKAVRFFTRLLQVCVLVGRGFYDNKCFLRASGLSFTTVLSIVPLLAFAFSLLRGLPYEDYVRGKITGYLAVGQEEIALKVNEYMDSTIERIRSADVTLLGVAGVVVLLWATVKVLSTVEDSFNEIWGVSQGRTWLRKFSDYTSIVIVAPVLLALAIGISTYLDVSPPELLGESGRYLVKTAVAVGPFVMIWAAFAALYAFMPNTRVSTAAALIGGLVGAGFWQTAFWGYTNFQVGVAKYSAIYGGFAALPIFLMWLYISWVITLFGAEVTFAYEHVETYRRHLERFNPSPGARERIALRVFLEIAKAFHAGAEPTGAERLSRKAKLPPRAVGEAVDVLSQAGLVSKVESATGSACQPAKDLARITPGDVLAALRSQGDPLKTDRPDKLWRETAALAEAFEQTLTRDDLNIPIAGILERNG